MKILLATDGSESAKAAIDFMLRFPFPKASEITLLTVINKALYDTSKKAELNEEQQRLLAQTKQMLQEEARELLTSGLSQLQAAGRTAVTRIECGHPSREIVRTAKRLTTDLIIVGSHGLSGVKRFLLGSVSDQVLAYAPCSVLIVKPEGGGIATEPASQPEPSRLNQPLKLLIAFDDSAPAKQAVELCASLPLSEQTEVTALTVLPLVTFYRQDIKQQLSWVWKEKKKVARKALERIQHRVKWKTPHVSCRLLESADVSQAILETAEAIHCDLIMLGHKGKGAITKFLLGSITTRIAHHAACSVLAVRRPKD